MGRFLEGSASRWTSCPRSSKDLTIGPFDSNQEVPESLQDVSRHIWGPELWRKTEVGTKVWICSLPCHPEQISGKDIFTGWEERAWRRLKKHLPRILVHFQLVYWEGDVPQQTGCLEKQQKLFGGNSSSSCVEADTQYWFQLNRLYIEIHQRFTRWFYDEVFVIRDSD